MKQKKQLLFVALFMAGLVLMGSCSKLGMTPLSDASDKSHQVTTTDPNLIPIPSIVFTLAGDTTDGFVDATGKAARFDQPNGITLDPQGNLIVADAFNRSIRRVTPAGVVSTVAGKIDNSGLINTDGPLSVARFGLPEGVVFDGAGKLFITDAASHRIRVISGDLVSTVAGGTGDNHDIPRGDFADGSGNHARFDIPWGIAADAAGNLYIGDMGNHRIRKVVPGSSVFTSFVTTFAGQKLSGLVDGQDTAARFALPVGVARDKAGNLYVADQFNHCIRKISPSGAVTTLAGNGTAGFVNGVGSAARFNNPTTVAIDNQGNVLVGDHLNFSLRKITPAGVVTTLAGNGTQGTEDGTTVSARFSEIGGIVVDPKGVIYLTDRNRIRVIRQPMAHTQ